MSDNVVVWVSPVMYAEYLRDCEREGRKPSSLYAPYQEIPISPNSEPLYKTVWPVGGLGKKRRMARPR